MKKRSKLILFNSFLLGGIVAPIMIVSATNKSNNISQNIEYYNLSQQKTEWTPDIKIIIPKAKDDDKVHLEADYEQIVDEQGKVYENW
ncbi:hypothetical protein NWQ33_02240 [Mycoplasmopsis cynos]|nr:hypothetical protein [Mycoplasmopsis cynos]